MSTMELISLSVSGLSFEGMAAGPATGELVLFLHGFPQFADSWLPILESVAAQGYRAVAIDQRGYSPEARPPQVSDYAPDKLTADVLNFATALGYGRFHLVAHDWGGLLAWQAAALRPERVQTLTVLSTPHPDAFRKAARTNLDQIRRSLYIPFFRMPFHTAERVLLADAGKRLRGLYDGKLAPEMVERNVRRLSAPDALTSALNWYRALSFDQRTGPISVSTLYFWGAKDVALGEAAAVATAKYVLGDYQFIRVSNASHWLIEESADLITPLLLDHLQQKS